jgi:hypothetical protein
MLWLRVAVEQYEALPVASQTLIDNALVQLDQRRGGADRPISPEPVARNIPAGAPTDHLIVHTVDLGRLVVVTRLVY